MNSIILKILKEARVSKKYNQADVGKAIGVKGNTIGNYENGVTEPDIDTFIALCKFYEISYIEVLQAAYGTNTELYSISEKNLIKKYRQLDADGKERIDTMLDMEVAQLKRKDETQSAEKAMWFLWILKRNREVKTILLMSTKWLN